MKINRRQLLAGVAAMGSVASRQVIAQEQWFPVTGDNGKPVANMRLPVELTSEIDFLEGIVWVGSTSPDVTVVEFFDYNCPYCRTAVKDIHELIRVDTGLRVGIVNNPILSQMSAQAAKVELALMILKDQSIIYDFHQRLFKRRGVIDGLKALDIAVGLGVPRSRIEEVANGPKVEGMLSDQMRLAASLGVSATPSFVIAGAGLFGYPGPKALARVIQSVRRCDQIVC